MDLMVTKREERSNSAEEDSEPGLKSPIDEPGDGCNKGSTWHSLMLHVSKRPGS